MHWVQLLPLSACSCLYDIASGVSSEELRVASYDACYQLFRFGIPENIGNSPVSVLVLANNNLGGCIPGSIGKMGKTLNKIILMNDNLTGCLPPQIGMLKKVTVFDGSFNHLQGALPSSIGNMKSVEQLDIAHNSFTGVVPASVYQLPTLQNFTYSFNYFTSEAPSCAAIEVVSNGTQNCIPDKMNQRSAKQCSSEVARLVDCSKFKYGGNGREMALH
ncbi:hypothetical protein D5086_032603 [Populus alba]|uniref:Uncharacterized protein n=1 Tax=Populus alba TaxID=43335 RepID=A0ACC4ALU5_POPAL